MMKLTNLLYCLILTACISMVCGCTSRYSKEKNIRYFTKDEYVFIERISDKHEVKYDMLAFGTPRLPILTMPDVEIEYEYGKFIKPEDIDLNYLSENGLVINREGIDQKNKVMLGITWPDDVVMYELGPYAVAYSERSGLLGIESYRCLNGLKLKSKGTKYSFPLSKEELIEIFNGGEARERTITVGNNRWVY